MANINTDTGRKKGGKRNKPQQKTLRVDFTPMVDMLMLLITFFMFCTTLAVPQAMDIVMPSDQKDDNPPEVVGSKTITLILGEDNKVYYYHGVPNYEDYNSLVEANYKDIRPILLEKNNVLFKQVNDLRKQVRSKQISESHFKEEMAKLKKSKESITVLIKPTENAHYANLVDVLDEMQICGVGKYMVVDLAEGDKFLLENLKTKGGLTAQM
ncbi:biopolymer transporter ExbD [Dysgonomonas sp. 25]|uniref:ExbD/TolR family protein n=1 Tax=Dysgonomonas sp. 25 TaxID=2302933 RepID=UPI0013CFA51B|nr:biopolymer transporter ExbD [Dysgonomonas sp. 25]NDV67338.1 biopolymer transporter ExbD [Dysgonomonas sp. 25]